MSDDSMSIDFDVEESMKDMASFIRSAGFVHQSELRELAEEWREEARHKSAGVRGTYEICAKELEELLDDDGRK